MGKPKSGRCHGRTLYSVQSLLQSPITQLYGLCNCMSDCTSRQSPSFVTHGQCAIDSWLAADRTCQIDRGHKVPRQCIQILKPVRMGVCCENYVTGSESLEVFFFFFKSLDKSRSLNTAQNEVLLCSGPWNWSADHNFPSLNITFVINSVGSLCEDTQPQQPCGNTSNHILQGSCENYIKIIQVECICHLKIWES